VKRPATLCALLLLALAVWEIAELIHVARAAPTARDWQQARAAVDEQFQRGDLLVFAPTWVDPLARMYFGDLMSVDDAARMDAARYGRVWEISIRGASSPDATGTTAFDARFGAVRVRRVERTAAHVTWDTRSQARLLEVDFAPRQCVPLHPPGTLDAGTVPLGAQLVVYAGISDFRARRENRAIALLRVLVDGTEVARAAIGNASGWRGLTPIATTPGPHTLLFESTPLFGNPARLDLCVAAEARE
jgi:hypothetical protein